MTIQENIKKPLPLEKVVFIYIGDDRNNIANSLLITGSIIGMDVRIISPKSLLPEENLVKEAKKASQRIWYKDNNN